MVALILGIEHTPRHHRVEAAQRGNQQVQAVGADGRPVGGLDEPALDAARSECTASLQQEQPGVLANRLRSSIPLIAVLGQETEPGSQHGQVRVASAFGADTFHEEVPLIEGHDELVVRVEDQPFVPRPAGWVREVRVEPQGGGPVQATELAARASLRAHFGAAIGYRRRYVIDKRDY